MVAEAVAYAESSREIIGKWLEFIYTFPGGHSETTVREIFDRIGVARRAAGSLADPGLSELPKIENTPTALARLYSVVVAPGDVSPQVLGQRLLAAMSPTLEAIEAGRTQSDSVATSLDITIPLPEGVAVLPGTLRADQPAMLTEEAGQLRVQLDELPPPGTERNSLVITFQGRFQGETTVQATIASQESGAQLSDDPFTAADGDATVVRATR